MKKLLSLMLAMVMVLSLAACGQAEEPETPAATKAAEEGAKETEASAEEQTVTVWAWDPNFNIAIMQKAADTYMAANPNVKFEIVDMAKGDLEQKLHTNLASGVTDDLPDIVLIEDYNAQKYLHAYPGSFESLSGSINHADFAPYKVELMSVDGQVYGVPFDSGVSGLFYRSDLLEQAGLSMDDVQDITWDEYIEIGQKVYDATGVYWNGYDPNDGGLMRIMLNGSGQWYFDADGNPTMAGNAALEESVRVYRDIMNADFTKKTSGWGEWVGGINSGEVATITTGVWIMGSVKAGEGQEGLWAVAPTPKLTVDGAVNASNLGGSSWYVLASSEEKAAAVDFLSATYDADTDFYQEILVDNGAVGTYVPSQSGTSYSAEDPFFGGQTIFVDFGEWMTEIPPINFGFFTYEADSALMQFMPQVYDGSMTPAEAVEAAEKQVSSQIQ
jgi:lactose/L-arabinose transport system substrate-binding protein